MKILGIETATKVCSVALAQDDSILDALSVEEGMVHSEKLLPMIDRLLSKKNLKPRDLDAIAVSIGPGSFTGIRIGVTAARALAQGLNIPAAGIPSLDGLIYNFRRDHRFISPMLDALREDVYTALYENGKRTGDFRVVQAGDWLRELRDRNRKVCFAGEGTDLHCLKIKEVMGENALIIRGVKASAESIALLGMEKLRENGGVEYHKLLPLYVRRAWAEVKREEREA